MSDSPQNIDRRHDKDSNSNGVYAQVPEMSETPFENNWRRYLVTIQPPDVPPLLSIHNAPVWTPENHSLIIGKKKTRKTLFLVWLISKYLKEGGKPEDILICDTEQGKRRAWNTRAKIFKMTGLYVNILSLRGKSIDERKEIIETAIQESAFKVVLIDGIRDLLNDINDLKECTELVILIERLTAAYRLHIVNVLHLNKTDNNARGHIGTELLNKAEITIELTRDEQTLCTVVKCESARDIHFEDFAFTHNADELPEIVFMPTKGAVMTEAEERKRLKFVFNGCILKYNEVIEGIKMHFEAGANKAGQILGKYLRTGWVVKTGRDHSPNSGYQLMIN